ncbi:MAG: sulfatase-like hydrolase/transferase [Vicinamibacterales bacterium]
MNGAAAFAPIWVALAGALVNVALNWFAWRSGTVPHLSPDFPWMTPLPLLVPAMLAAVIIAAARRRAIIARVLVFAAGALVGFDLALKVPGMAHYAAAVLGAGLGVQLARIATSPGAAFERILRRSFVPLAVGLGVLVLGATLDTRATPQAVAGTPRPGAPNVIVVTLDTVRAGHLSLYGYGRDTSPNVRAFAGRGVTFDAAFSAAPWTLPSHASMFTGRWPHELSANYDVPLDAATPTLAEFFSARGYATAGFVSNLQYCGRTSGLSRGFGHYEDYPRSIGSVVSCSVSAKAVVNNFRLRRLIGNDQHTDRVDASEINARALAWLEDQGDRPFMMFLNYFDAHEPYLPPPPYDRAFGPGRAHGRFSPLHHWGWNPAFNHRPLTAAEQEEEIDAYDGSLKYLDFRFGEFLQALDRDGRLANTIVVITADHGEEFAEHGVYEHGYTLYHAGVHVPLVFVAPGLPAGVRIPTPVSVRDLAATVAALADATASSAFPGHSLAAHWQLPAGEARSSPAFSTVRRPPGQPDWFPVSKGDMQALTTDDGLRYIVNGDGREELYDLAADPAEKDDLVQRPERRAQLEAARAAVASLLAGREGR